MVAPKMLIMTHRITAFTIWGSFLSLTNNIAVSLMGSSLQMLLSNILLLNGILLVLITLNQV